MEPVKYFYETYDNRDQREEKQGYAMILPISAAEQNHLTDHLISESMRGGKKKVANIDYGKKTLSINRKKCPKVFNVTNPLTDEHHSEILMDDLYNNPVFKDLYEELANAIGDINILREGIKKS